VNTINPHIYGHFIEHLGGVIYDGVWVGRGSRIPNVNGIRKQFVDDIENALERLTCAGPAAVLPTVTTGAMASGRLPRDHALTIFGNAACRRAPTRRKPTNSEFMNSCSFAAWSALSLMSPRMSAPARPLSSTTGFLTANAPAGTLSLADERAANGDPQPFNIQYWGVGNESWGCGA
jgi:alpha-N-arabinofuranosidase